VIEEERVPSAFDSGEWRADRARVCGDPPGTGNRYAGEISGPGAFDEMVNFRPNGRAELLSPGVAEKMRFHRGRKNSLRSVRARDRFIWRNGVIRVRLHDGGN